METLVSTSTASGARGEQHRPGSPRPAAYVFCLVLMVAQAVTLWHYGRQNWTTRLDDIRTIQAALERYRADVGSYPVAEYRSLFQPGVSQVDWIPGLVPRYLSSLPRDPRLSQRTNLQYSYKSDGKDYKLIVHGPEDFGLVAATRPEMVDPRRSTLAYGVWTPGGAQW